MNALELFLVDSVEADGASDPLWVGRRAEIVQNTGKAEYLIYG